MPDDIRLVAAQQEAEFSAFKWLVGRPVAVGALTSFVLVVEAGEVVAVGHGHGAGLIADELAVVGVLVSCLVDAGETSHVDAVCYGASAIS
mgnify:CR=1 FL=1